MRKIIFSLSIMIVTAVAFIPGPQTAFADQSIVMISQTVDANSPVMRTCVLSTDLATSVDNGMYINIIATNGNDDVGVCSEQFAATTKSATFTYLGNTNSRRDADVGTNITARDVGTSRFPLKEPMLGTAANATGASTNTWAESRCTIDVNDDAYTLLSPAGEIDDGMTANTTRSPGYPLKGPIVDAINLKI